MLINYIRLALRNFRKDKAYAGLNLLGLAVGMAGFLLILQYAFFELSYDRYHSGSDQIFRVAAHQYKGGEHELGSATTYFMLGPSLKEDFPEVERFTRFFPTSGQVAINEERFREERMYYADSTLFELFSIPLLRGDARTALAAPNSVAIAESVARRYFGSPDCLGQALELSNWYRQREYVVSAVFQDMPDNTHLSSGLFFSMSTLTQEAGTLSDWGWRDFYTYIKLKKGTTDDFQSKISVPLL